MKLAVLSNINFKPIQKITKDCYVSGVSEYFSELVNKNSFLNKNKFDVVFVHLDFEDNLTSITSILDDILKAIRVNCINNPDVLYILSNFYEPVYHSEHYLKNNNMDKFIKSINNKITSLLELPNFYVFNFSKFLIKYGYNNIVNYNFWYLGRIKYSIEAYNNILRELENIYNSYVGKVKKVLLLDLDNTLWGGIIGEDGIKGVKLSEDGEGKIYRDFQKNILKLKNLGVLLCIVSKNNFDDVENMFKNHPMMILKLDDFVVKKINWNSKVDNIKEISMELNLGIDSFVFIDDSPFERNLVREMLPQCNVPEFPSDITLLNKWFYEEIVYKYFPKLNVTKEDKEKFEQYLRNYKRETMKKGLSLDDYIKSLDIKLNFYIDDKRFLTRAAQLTQKTNQFNLTTRRYTESQINEIINSPNSMLILMEYEDKFGKEGIVGLSIINISDDTALIDSFLMSCRVIGRNVEFDFLKYILDILKKKGVKKIFGEYIPTPKNIIVKDFYNNAGFLIVEDNKFIKEL